jgi:hypothetical protein
LHLAIEVYTLRQLLPHLLHLPLAALAECELRGSVLLSAPLESLKYHISC